MNDMREIMKNVIIWKVRKVKPFWPWHWPHNRLISERYNEFCQALYRDCGCSVTSQTGSKRPSEPIFQRHWTHFHCLKPLYCTYSMLSIAPLKWVTTKGKSFLFVEKARQWYWYRLPCLFSLLNVFNGNQKLIWESCYIVYFGCGQASVTTNHMVWILVDGNRTQNNDKNYEKK